MSAATSGGVDCAPTGATASAKAIATIVIPPVRQWQIVPLSDELCTQFESAIIPRC